MYINVGPDIQSRGFHFQRTNFNTNIPQIRSLSSSTSDNGSFLERQVRTTESRSNRAGIVSDDGFNSSIQPGTQQEETDQHDKDVHDGRRRPERAGKEPPLVHDEVRDGEVDEAEEGVEGGAEQRQEVAHAGHDLGEDEREAPDAGHDDEPHAPPDDGVAVGVARPAHDTRVDELGADVGVDHADDDGRHDHERERALFVRLHAQAAERRRRRVLPQVAEADRRRDDEEEERDCGQHGQRLREVLRLLHLCDEGWE